MRFELAVSACIFVLYMLAGHLGGVFDSVADNAPPYTTLAKEALNKQERDKTDGQHTVDNFERSTND